MQGEVSLAQIKDVTVEDLLGRDTIQVDMEQIFQYIKGKTILVTGRRRLNRKRTVPSDCVP